jgi:hypothetical protein
MSEQPLDLVLVPYATLTALARAATQHWCGWQAYASLREVLQANRARLPADLLNQVEDIEDNLGTALLLTEDFQSASEAVAWLAPQEESVAIVEMWRAAMWPPAS